MSISINPLSFSSRRFTKSDGQTIDSESIKKFLGDLAQWANQIQAILTVPANLSSILNASRTLRLAQSSVLISSSPTTNQVVDTNQSSLVFVRYNWSTAANFTITLNNVVDGQILSLYVTNSSGAPRTFTVLANTILGSAITPVTGTNVLSSGVSVGSGVSVAYSAMAMASALVYQGTGQNW